MVFGGESESCSFTWDLHALHVHVNVVFVLRSKLHILKIDRLVLAAPIVSPLSFLMACGKMSIEASFRACACATRYHPAAVRQADRIILNKRQVASSWASDGMSRVAFACVVPLFC